MRNANETDTGGGGRLTVPQHELRLDLPLEDLERLLQPGASVPSRRLYSRFAKPLLDRLVAGTLCLVAAPVLLLIAAAVAVSLGPPVLLRQERIGLDGRPFGMFKFRTMRPDRRSASSKWDGVDRRRTHKTPDDPRHVPLGRFLRRWSLDELPQLLNVVRGEMSLVGPRPELVSVVERHYQPWQHARHQVKPGVTGLWQVTERGLGMMHEHVATDLRYVESMSLRTDVKILFMTLPAALGLRRGD